MDVDNSTQNKVLLDDDYVLKLKDLLEHTPVKGVCSALSSKKNQYLKDWIYHKTSYLDSKYNVCHRIYWILNNITEFPKCHVCGKPVTMNCGLNGYPDVVYCSHLCSARSDIKFKKSKDTCLKKYGTEWSFQNEECKSKAKQACLDKYGCEYPSQSDEIKKKMQNKCLEKYGTNYAFQSKEVKDKIKQTCLNKYGYESATKCDAVKEKQRQTCLSRYGKDRPLQVDSIKQKFYNTMIERYGSKTTLECDQLKKKAVNTMISKYGVNAYAKCDEFRKKSSKSQRIKYYREKLLCNDIVIPLFTEDEYANCENHHKIKLKWKCKKCGNEFEYVSDYNWKNVGRCPTCYPKLSGRSKMEEDVYDFIRSSLPENIEVIPNARFIIQPKELDIYIPAKKLAIEFDGLFWHSYESGISQKYHIEKTEDCEKQGIQLIHIFEDEWVHKQDIVKSIIKSKLGIFDRSTYARKCEVKEVKHKECRDFLNSNHIQGSCNSSINLGLYYNGELVSIMTFGKSRYNKQYKYEMYRFCNLLNTKVIGGASKLLNCFIKQNDTHSIITYCDRRFSNGHLYDILGMKKLYETQPNYFYVIDESVRESRLKYQKHKLKKLLENYDPKLNEYENMANNGYFRIYDCGNYAYGFEESN